MVGGERSGERRREEKEGEREMGPRGGEWKKGCGGWDEVNMVSRVREIVRRWSQDAGCESHPISPSPPPYRTHPHTYPHIHISTTAEHGRKEGASRTEPRIPSLTGLSARAEEGLWDWWNEA